MRRVLTRSITVVVAAALLPSAWALTARGVVFHDRDGDSLMDPREPGIAGVGVSNGEDVTLTDEQGRWQLPCGDYTVFFVIKPAQWRVPIDRDGLWRGYYIHCPSGAPPLRYEGVAPTGPLPRSIDFPLTPVEEPDRFEIVCFGDPQPGSVREVELIAQDLVEQVARDEAQAAFGIVLGDVANNDLSLLPLVRGTLGRTGFPWYYAMGNHDRNYDTAVDMLSTTTWHRVMGPDHYSFNYGPIHFIVLENIAHQENGHYTAGLTEAQLRFVREDLRHVPKDSLIVYMQHIPVMEQADCRRFLQLFEQHPRVLGLSAHWHSQEHFFLGAEHGWPHAIPHHHLVHVASCGAWWEGRPDHQGIPPSTAPDGTPNGYSVIRFDGDQYEIIYRAARREPSYQMRLWALEEVAPGAETFLYANVFGGSARSTVEYRLTPGEAGPGDWRPMERVAKPDPEDVRAIQERYREVVVERTEYEGDLPIDVPVACAHLWHSQVIVPEQEGYYRVEVRTRDAFGHTYEGVRVLRVLGR